MGTVVQAVAPVPTVRDQPPSHVPLVDDVPRKAKSAPELKLPPLEGLVQPLLYIHSFPLVASTWIVYHVSGVTLVVLSA